MVRFSDWVEGTRHSLDPNGDYEVLPGSNNFQYLYVIFIWTPVVDLVMYRGSR